MTNEYKKYRDAGFSAQSQREKFLEYVPNRGIDHPHSGDTLIPHMQFAEAWKFLDGPNPALLLQYLRWLHDDETRLLSACDHIEWLEVGFHKLTLAVETDKITGELLSSIQANLYTEEFPGNEDPHAHSRNAKTVWYAAPEGRQINIQSKLLPAGTRPVTDLPVYDARIVVNCLTPRDGGRSPIYNPVVVGEGYIAQLTSTSTAPMSEHIFNSIGVHHVGDEGPGVALSMHVKGKAESQALNDFHGLVNYKGLTEQQAEMVLGVAPAEYSQAPKTLILPTRDFDPTALSPVRSQPNRGVAERLLHGALLTAEKLATIYS